MGLRKAEYNHEATSVAEATGYYMETIIGELVPKALLHGRQIVQVAGACPTMAVEIMMDSPVLKDPGLDNRDRAMIVILSGSVVARDLLTEIVEKRGRDILRAGLSVHGFDFRNGQGLDRVFGVPKTEIAMLNEYVRRRVFDGMEKISRLVENLEKALDDALLSPFHKAFIEAVVSRQVTGRTAHRISPMGLIAEPATETALAGSF
jgi:hypothetical protein